MFSIAVLRLGLSPEYVLDEMQIWEFNLLCKNIKYRISDSWEQTRWIIQCLLQINSPKKKVKLEQVCKFSWDTPEEHRNITKEDIKALRQKQDTILSLINKHG